MDAKIDELKSEAIATATEHIREQRKRGQNIKTIAACLTVLLAVAMICATVLGCFAIVKQQETIIEQQYALNMQYASLMDLLYGAEVTTETTTNEADAGDGGTAVAGENNTVVWGDANGDG